MPMLLLLQEQQGSMGSLEYVSYYFVGEHVKVTLHVEELMMEVRRGGMEEEGERSDRWCHISERQSSSEVAYLRVAVEMKM